MVREIKNLQSYLSRLLGIRDDFYECFCVAGQDYVRALMLFSHGKPLGEKGLAWLKLHLINIGGLKKR